jgi:hypothetical protein
MGKTKTLAIFLLSAFFVLIPSSGFATAYRLASPDGDLTVSVEIKANPQPYLPGERAYYRIDYRGKALLADSPLGLDFLGAKPLDQGFEVLGTDRDSHDSTWENPFGARRVVRDHYNQLKVSLREKQAPNRRVDLIFRAYDEGVAFRYALPEQVNLRQFTLAAENTGFYFPTDAHAYALNIRWFSSPYESDYSYLPLDDIKPTSIVPLPLLLQLPQGPWVGLLEADLTNYAGMYVGGVQGVSGAQAFSAAQAFRPSGDCFRADGDALARVDGQPHPHGPAGIKRPGFEPESTLRFGRHFLDQTRQSYFPLVVGILGRAGSLSQRREHSDVQVLH